MPMEEYNGPLVTTLVDIMDQVEQKHWQESMLVTVFIIMQLVVHEVTPLENIARTTNVGIPGTWMFKVVGVYIDVINC